MSADPQTLAGALVQIEQLAWWHRDGEPFSAEKAMKRLIAVLPERIERLVGEV